MFEAVWTFLEGSVEWQAYTSGGFFNFFNTLSTLGIIALTVYEIYGIWQQGRTIWEEGRADAVSVFLFSFLCWAFPAFSVYAAYINSAVGVGNGVFTGAVQLYVIAGIFKFRKLQWWEWAAIAVCPVMPLAVYLTAHTALQTHIFIVISFGVGIAFSLQAVEMMLKRRTGDVNINMYRVYMVTAVAWLVYSITVGDAPFIFSQCIGTTAIFGTVAVWCYWRAREPNPPKSFTMLLIFGQSKKTATQ